MSDNDIKMDEVVQMSSDSQPQQIDLDDLNDIRVDPGDLDQLDQLFATTKQDLSSQKKQISSEGNQTSVSFDFFLRNFFIKNKMNQTLQNFQQQWYQLKQKNGEINGLTEIPMEYIKSQKLRDDTRKLRDQLDKAVIVAQKARGTYDKLLKQRNFHKMHHQRVQQEKKKLNAQLEKLRNRHLDYEKKYDDMAQKYSHLMKQKMLIKLERDRLKTRAQIQRQMNPVVQANQVLTQDQKVQKFSKTKVTADKVKFTAFPADERFNPHSEEQIKAFEYKNTILFKTFKGHQMAITGLAIHPRKPILATVSDDLSWKLWTVPQGQLIMSGQGHKQWISSVKFHPKGLHILTSSGDSTIKIWDFTNTACTHTFKDHTQSVWDLDVHDTGDFFASAGMDHLGKVFDINVGKSRHSLRGHVDSVNSIRFQPYSNIIVTGSADKTVSLWDMKSSLCIQTFYGHNNSVNSCAFNLTGDKIVSGDSDGIVKVWDVRMVKEKETIDFSQYSANSVCFDSSGTIIGGALQNGDSKIYNMEMSKFQSTLKGHDDAVQDILFDLKAKAIYTCSSDSTFRIWQ